MIDNLLLRKCQDYLKSLCADISERCVGSNCNRQATSFLEKELSLCEWETEMVEFHAIDNFNIVDCSKIVEISQALNTLIRSI